MDYNFDLVHWHKKAECRKHDPELWWSYGSSKKQTEAKRICLEECPVLFQCREWILHLEQPQDRSLDPSVCGGLTKKERSVLKKEAYRASKDPVGSQQRNA